MNSEHDLAARITRRLDLGLTEIDQRSLTRLRSARETALERLELQPTWSYAGAGNAPGFPARGHAFTFRHLASVLMLLAAVAGMVYWQQTQRDDLVDIDAKLLSGDLPIDAYLDKGLDTWLTR
jgi:hypothetical protein